MAFPTWPSLTAGHELTDTDTQQMSDYIAAITPQYAEQAANQSVTSSTALVSAVGLSVSLAASAKYVIRGHILYTGGTTGDFKIGQTIPTGATGWVRAQGPDVTSVSGFSALWLGFYTSFASTFGFGIPSAAFDGACLYEAMVLTSTTAGSYQVQFAQNTSDGTASTLRAGSNLLAFRVA